MKTYWTFCEALDYGDGFGYMMNEALYCRPYKLHRPYKTESTIFMALEKYCHNEIKIYNHDLLFETEQMAIKAYIKALEEKIVECNEEIDFAKERLGVK